MRAPAATYAWWWDVTIRSPHAARQVRAHEDAAAAARTGLRDKAARYGQDVATLSFETHGRLHEQSATLLEVQVAELAAIKGTWPSAMLRLWRRRLERAVLMAQADVALLCLGHRAADTALSAQGAAAALQEQPTGMRREILCANSGDQRY